MQVLTQGDIQVDSVIPVLNIRDFRMEIRGNAHIYARIEGMVSDEEGEVMQAVLADTPGAKLQFHVEDREIGTPLYQLEETDWAFLKRLAGRLHTGVIVCASSTVPDIHIGVPKGGKHKTDDKMMRESIRYDREHRTFCLRMRTGENWQIGDGVDCEEGLLTVTEKECRLEQGLLYFYNTLAKRAFVEADTCDNTYATGVLLGATVLDVQGEEVKVKFDVDKEQPVESAYWYPWEPDMDAGCNRVSG